ncbi:MAG: PadR family transcriptional regulator [Phycisphaerae bacterium]|nr:PadR family transcriptional regulator [Phycisphaerae bacterium]
MADGFFDNWTTQLRKGLLELCVLSAIRSQRLYGYDIVKRLREIEGLVISEGTIYPILSRFKREGLVSATIEESREGPPRKYYQLTSSGRRQLQQMIRYWRLIAAGVDKLQE